MARNGRREKRKGSISGSGDGGLRTFDCKPQTFLSIYAALPELPMHWTYWLGGAPYLLHSTTRPYYRALLYIHVRSYSVTSPADSSVELCPFLIRLLLPSNTPSRHLRWYIRQRASPSCQFPRHNGMSSRQTPINSPPLPINITRLVTTQKQRDPSNLIRHRAPPQRIQLSYFPLRTPRPRH